MIYETTQVEFITDACFILSNMTKNYKEFIKEIIDINLLPYIYELDRYILNEFIIPCLLDLKKLAEYITDNEIKSVENELKKFFNH